MVNAKSISVILSNYNGAEHLGETIDSVFAQSVAPHEFLIVDDASTDGSVAVIEERLSDAPFSSRLICHDTNLGQGGGFNTAYHACTGDWICTLDSDDLWKPEKLARIEEAATAHPDCPIIQHQLAILRHGVWTDESVLAAMTSGNMWKMWLEEGAFPHFVPTSGLAFSRQAMEKVMPIPEALRISADSFLTRTAICHGPVLSLQEQLGGYRIHDSNSVAGNSGHDSRAFFLEKVRPLLLTYYEEHGLDLPYAHMEPLRLGTVNKLLDYSLRKFFHRMSSLTRSK